MRKSSVKVVLTMLIVSLIGGMILTACGRKKDKDLKELEALLEDEDVDIDEFIKDVEKKKNEEPIEPAQEPEYEEDDYFVTEAGETIYYKDLEPQPTQNEKIVFELVEVSDEIKNSKLSDKIIQIGNVVLPNDGSLTVREVLERLNADQPVRLSHSDYAEDGLFTEDVIDSIGIYIDTDRIKGTDGSEFDAVENCICNLSVIPEEDDPKPVMDHKVQRITAGIFPQTLNEFYPGNICAAYNNRPEYMKESTQYDIEEAVKQRNEEYPFYEMKYDDFKEYVEKLASDAGLEIEEKNNGWTINIENNKEKKYGLGLRWLTIEMDMRQNQFIFFDARWF